MTGPARDIAVIDVSPLSEAGAARDAVIADILQACKTIGFFCVTGTGVSQGGVHEMRDVVRRVFAVPEADKWRQAITRDNYRGYIPLGFFSPNDGSGTADRYEGYKLHRETAEDDPIRDICPLYGPNRWPEGVADARYVILGYWAHMDALADLLLRGLAEGLGLAEDAFARHFAAPLTNMTLLHYPQAAPDAAGFGIHPHKDTCALTIIAPDPVGGLEIRKPGGDGWAEPDCPGDGFVVNIGDMLELWSGGRLVSTPHRVINPRGHERYSFPYFAVPGHDVTGPPLLPQLAGIDRPPVQ